MNIIIRAHELINFIIISNYGTIFYYIKLYDNFKSFGTGINYTNLKIFGT